MSKEAVTAEAKKRNRDLQVRLLGVPLLSKSQMLSLDSVEDPSEAAGSNKKKCDSQVRLLGVPLSPASPSLSLSSSTSRETKKCNDLQLGFTTHLYRSLEKHLPLSLTQSSDDDKAEYLRNLLLKYKPEGEHQRIQNHKAYKQKILSKYKPKHRELYRMHAETFFVPSFLQAISDNTGESFRSVIKEPFPGIYAFEMLQPHICDMFLSEIDNIEKWIIESGNEIMRPNTMNKYGAVLDDFGFDVMLDELLNDFLRPICGVFFHDVGGSMLDSHHGFVVEYGIRRDIDLGLHVDDSEVTLNVCLGKQFTGGELFFRGVRCDKHINTGTRAEELFDYFHLPGNAILHRGRHRHGARATTSGYRVNLIMWCRSAAFRHLQKYQNDFSSWCGECQYEKKERQESAISAAKLELMRRLGNLAH